MQTLTLTHAWPQVRMGAVEALHSSLQQRNILNSKLAEQLRRLKALAAACKPSPDPAADAPAPAGGPRMGEGSGGGGALRKHLSLEADLHAAVKLTLAPGVLIQSPGAMRQALISGTLAALQVRRIPRSPPPSPPPPPPPPPRGPPPPPAPSEGSLRRQWAACGPRVPTMHDARSRVCCFAGVRRRCRTRQATAAAAAWQKLVWWRRPRHLRHSLPLLRA